MTTENTEVTTTEPEVKNPDALLKKNRELLRELAEVKAALQTAQDGLKAAQDAHSKTTEQLHSIRVTEPLARIVGAMSPHPGLMMKVLNDLFDVKLDADNKPVLFNKQGEPLIWTKKGQHGHEEQVSVSLEQDSLFQWIINGFDGNPDSPAALLPKAQGTGAPGAPHSHSYTSKPAAAPAAPPPAPITPLGLR